MCLKLVREFFIPHEIVNRRLSMKFPTYVLVSRLNQFVRFRLVYLNQ